MENINASIEKIKKITDKLDTKNVLINILHLIIITVLIFSLNKYHENILALILSGSYTYLLSEKYNNDKNMPILLYIILPIVIYLMETIVHIIQYKKETNEIKKTSLCIPIWKVPLYGMYLIVIFETHSLFV